MQTLIGTALIVLALTLAWGASTVSSEAGYGGVGPNFFPWVVSIEMLVCGLLCVVHALTGVFRALEEGSGDVRRGGPHVVKRERCVECVCDSDATVCVCA